MLQRRILFSLAAWLVALVPAAAQEWPSRPVKIIIPLGAGGGGDIYTRLLADKLRERFGQPFVVENRTGGGLNIGTRACAESPNDGYTLCVISSEPIVYNQFLYRTLPFDPEKDFEPITNLFSNTLALVANSKLQVKTIPEMIALAKTKPGQLSYGTFSFPLAQYMDRLNKENGTDIVRVPFRSGNEVVNAVMSGSSPIAFLGLSNMIPQIQSGHINALAVNATNRSPLFPDVPTLKEVSGANYPMTWFGMFAPAGTPRPIVDKVAAAVASITSDPTFMQKNYVERAVEYEVNTPDEFAKFIVQDRERARVLVKESGQKPI